MATVRNVLTQIQSIVEGTTPDTPRYDSSPRFKHTSTAYDVDDVRDYQSPTRRFILLPTGNRQPVGPMGATTSPIQVEQTFDLSIQYRQATDAAEFFSVICEDVDRLAWRLMTPSLWDQGTTGISLVSVDGYAVDIGASGANATAVVTIPVTVRYLPAF